MSPSSSLRHIGFVVLGSLGAGFLLAVILVLLPFAGARENVISGAVLLAFAFGWASLAILSVRLTDQPQRWAAVPAVLTAFAGAVLLLWPGSVTHDSLGWVWPVPLGVLVGWDGDSEPEASSQSRSYLAALPDLWRPCAFSHRRYVRDGPGEH